MSKYLAMSVVCLLFPVTARAQDELIKNFSKNHVEKFIKDVMKADPVGKMDERTKMFMYSTPDGQYDIWVRTTPGSRALFFLYDFQNLKAPAEKVNAWNFNTRHTRAATGPNGKLSLQASLNTEAGLTLRQLTGFYEQIQQEREAFIKLIENK